MSFQPIAPCDATATSSLHATEVKRPSPQRLKRGRGVRLGGYDAFEFDAYVAAASHDGDNEETSYYDPSACIERAIEAARGGVLPTDWGVARELKDNLLLIEGAMKLGKGKDKQ